MLTPTFVKYSSKPSQLQWISFQHRRYDILHRHCYAKMLKQIRPISNIDDALIYLGNNGKYSPKSYDNDIRSYSEPHLYFLRYTHFTKYDVLHRHVKFRTNIHWYLHLSLVQCFLSWNQPVYRRVWGLREKKSCRGKMSPKKDF